MYIISIDESNCIGAGRCVTIAPRVFELVNGIAVLLDPQGDNDETILDAARSCPTLCIYLDTLEGNPIFPPITES